MKPGGDSADAAALAAAVAAADAARAAPGPAPGDGAAPGQGAGAPPPGGAAPPADDKLRLAAHAAGLVCGFLFEGAAKQWPATAFTPEEKASAVAVLTPVFRKYDVTPAWLEKYQEELAAAVVIGGLAWTGYQRQRAAHAAGAPDRAQPVEGVVIPSKAPA